MSDIKRNGLIQHISERQLVDYVQQRMVASELQPINSHLIECQKCAERLSSLILFAAENQLLKLEQENVIDRFLSSIDYDLLKYSFINRAIDSYRRKCNSV
jgi:hypothetical protein